MFAQISIPVQLHNNTLISQELRTSHINYLTFDEAVNLHEFGAIPLYNTEIELPSDFFGCEIEIHRINNDTIVDDNIIVDRDLISDQIQNKIIVNEGLAEIYVMPYYIGENGKDIIFIKEFELIVYFVPVAPKKKSKVVTTTYSDESVLASGEWFKMGILQSGVHKLSYSDISLMGISPESIDVNKIGIYGNYAGLLPEANNKFRYDDLQENSIQLIGTEDGSFDTDDYILFYAQAPTTWEYNPFTGRFTHETNIYSDTSYYFFTPNKGSAKQFGTLSQSSETPTHNVTSFVDHAVHENDWENMISSGKEWYGERLEGDTIEREFSFSFPNTLSDQPVFLELDIIGRAFVDSYYDIFVNDELIVDSTKIRFINTSLGIFARKSTTAKSFLTNSDNINIKIKYNSDDANAIAWIDFIVLNAERQLVFNGNQMNFCNPHVSALGNISNFIIEQTSDNDVVWDITDIHNPRIIEKDYASGNTTFSVPTDSIKTFTIFNGEEYYSPVSYEEIPNQNLHGITEANFIIIRPEIFADEAERLANIHRYHDGLITHCISLEQLYNEFSSGSQDITAIRDFMRMLYKKDVFGGERAYLMLFGDASFDYKHRIHENTNIVPTFESLESLRETGSFVTDDYFGLLDDNEGSEASGNLDIGIGRFPVSTMEQASAAVDKIENYLLKKEGIMGDWRTNICFVADDRDNNLHLKQAEGLISVTDTLHSGIGINKIFLDAYVKTTVPGGFRYPDVNKKINKQVTDGALIINYTGHGGLIGWSDELVLDVPMISAFNNYDNMPLIITATCEFSRYDNPEFTSAGEYTFLNQEGGAIGLLTTTRLAYAHANYIVNGRIYRNLLSCDENGSRPRLGDLVRLSKIPSNENYLNFVLLGDPALMLAYPQYDVVTTQSRSSSVNVSDTVRALSIVNVSGEIHDKNGLLVEDFSGFVYPKVLDKESKYTTLGNDGNSYPQDFTVFDKILFNGKVTVDSGRFNYEFMVPKDISYHFGYGKISYYALDTTYYRDAWGAFEELLIGGIDENADIDDIGPEIDIYLNNNSFISGDNVTSNPVLLSYIRDDHGVNNTGSGIGRDITMILDNDYSNPVIMNDIFEMDIDSYKSGKIIYPFNELEEGMHTLTIKAWDLQNNSSEKTIEFLVDNSARISLSEVYNYPNPFYNHTEFHFNHNKNGSILNAKIKIYDTNGRFIVELVNDNNINTESSYTIIWDGKDYNNELIMPGIYIYIVEVSDEYNNVTVQQQKLIRINK